MKDDNYIVIRCNACKKFPCKAACKKNAIAFTAGDLIIETEKCTGCAKASGKGIPLCIETCRYSAEKAVIPILNTEIKRKNAAYTLSLI